MKATTGDRIILAPKNVDGPTRDGEVIEVRGADGAPPYLVRWSDGHEGLFFPGPGSIRSVGHEEATAGPAQATPTPPPRMASHVHDWTVRISMYETDDDTAAHAVLLSGAPEHLTAHGHSRRHPDDRAIPEIGDEVAVARALHHLADQLLAAAEGDIEAVTGQRAHVARR